MVSNHDMKKQVLFYVCRIFHVLRHVLRSGNGRLLLGVASGNGRLLLGVASGNGRLRLGVVSGNGWLLLGVASGNGWLLLGVEEKAFTPLRTPLTYASYPWGVASLPLGGKWRTLGGYYARIMRAYMHMYTREGARL